MILFVNSCVRTDSRTRRLAEALLNRLGDCTELRLEDEDLHPLTEETLNRRTAAIEAGDYSSPMFRWAKQFAEADVIVVAAPYWDLSFPAKLKVYLENVYVTGLVSRYDPDGTPRGLCRAKKLYYVTTAGGPYQPDFSFRYLKEMAERYFGIGQARLLAAENLDIFGSDPEAILRDAMAKIDELVKD